ncbi:MAG: flagellar hook-associated protein FlgL [Clostridiaceae bacterium]
MRITNGMLTTSFLSDMNRNLKNMTKIQEQLTSGKEVSKPSDDPVRVSRSMRLNSDILANNQYKTNIQNVNNYLDSTDTSLGQLSNVLTSMNEKLIAAGNAAYGSDERTAILNQINEQIGHFSQIMNTNFDGKYLFGGTRVTDKPATTMTDINGNTIIDYANIDGTALTGGTFAAPSATVTPPATTSPADEYSKVTKNLSLEISQGVVMDYNIGANKIFEFKDKNNNPQDLRQIFKDIVTHLKSGTSSDIDALVGTDLTNLQAASNNLLKLRAEVGAKQNRMDDASAKNTEDNFNLTEILSKTEDIDVAEKTMQFATLQSVYTASLQTSARVIQPTILDYLR